MASHPSTPTEMIVSSDMLDSEELEFVWVSSGFMRAKGSLSMWSFLLATIGNS